MNNNHTFRVVLAAIFIAIGVVLFFFSFTINLFGVPAVRVDFISVPIMIAGFILGKWYGLAVGTLVDLIGFFSAPIVGAYFFGFTLNLALVGFVSGFLPQILKKISPTFTKASLISLLTVSVIAAVTYIAMTPSIPLGTQDYMLDSNVKIALIVTILMLTMLSFLFFSIILRETGFSTNHVQKIIVTMLIAELILIILTPIWVFMLYQNPPFFVGVVSRLVRASFIFPVKVIVVLAVLNALRQQETIQIEVLT